MKNKEQKEEIKEQNAEKEEVKSDAQTEQKEETIESVSEKLAESKNQYAYLLAEFDNYKKRTLKEKSDLLKYGGENVIKNILPIVDDFERAVDNLPDGDDPIKEGVLLIYKKFTTFLEQNNVKVIATENEEFNTDFHEAATMFPAADESQKNKIIDCVQKGYTYNDKVIRYAKVVVAQ